jgi:hypothetical protein
MVNVPVLLWYTALPVIVVVFAMSAVLVIETALAVAMVPLDDDELLPVIFPLSVTAPQAPLKLADAVPMFNVAPSSPNCMAASPLPSVLIASMTVCIGWSAVPTVSPPLAAVNAVPLPVMM